MKLKRAILLVGMIAAVSGVPAQVACGDETKTLIDEIIKGARTDAERSAKLLEAVSLVDDNEKLKLDLLAKAAEYAMKSLKTVEDCNRTLRILDMLTQTAPERASEWQSQRVRVFSRLLSLTKPADRQKLAAKIVSALVRTGHSAAVKGNWKNSVTAYTEARKIALSSKLPIKDNIAVRIRILTSLYRAQDKTVKYTALLKGTPGNTEVRTNLVETLLTMLDDPATAAKHVNEDIDQKSQAYIPLAAKDVSEVPAEGCKSLAQWYHKELSKTVSAVVKYKMLKRAKAYYQRAIELHSKADATGAALLKLAVSGIDTELSKVKYADPLSCVYCLASGQMACADCLVVGKSTGTVVCPPCEGRGRVKCSSCDGHWGVKCTSCAGKGGTYSRRYNYRTGKYSRYFNKCYSCGGARIRHKTGKYGSMSAGACPTCGKQVLKYRGSALCSTCKGKGRSGQCDGCNGAKTVSCTQCDSDSGL